MQLARGQTSTIISEAKDAGRRGHNGTFVMSDSVAAVLGLVSAGIFLAHAIESYCTHALVGAEAPFTSFKQGPKSDRKLEFAGIRVLRGKLK